MNYNGILKRLACILFLFVIYPVYGQITAPGSVAAIPTEYTAFPETDNIFIFCSGEQDNPAAALQAETTITGNKTYLWEKYNPVSGNFEFYSSETTAEQQSLISGLSDGGYRVSISSGEPEVTYRGWVFNNQVTATAAITGSGCDSFTLLGEFTSSPIIYYDPANNAELEILKDIQIEWLQGGTSIGNTLEMEVFNLPAQNTEYLLRVYDQFSCEATSSVLYESVVPVAAFTADPMQGEAPLTVTFNNLSVNADASLYEWFFYRDLDDIKRESERTQQPIDSIMYIDNNPNPTFVYENSGTYKVKLVAKKSSEFLTCTDTAYLEGFIRVDTSFISVPNVFTPNGDGINDLFVVKFWSMQSIKISIFNRWGKRIHFWESNNVRGFDEAFTATVWDGRSGGRFATPGVYYYVVEGQGRDDKTRKAHGFFHLFRDKD